PVGLPGHVVVRVADAKHRKQQQVHRAGARSDHEVGSGDGAGKRSARLRTYALHAEEQGYGKRNGDHRQRRGQAAVAQAFDGERQDHAVAPTSIVRSNKSASERSWLAKTSVADARAHSRNNSSRKTVRRSASSADVGSSARISSGAPISAR